MAKYEYMIGSTQGSMQYLFDLGVRAPRQAPKPYSKALELGDGTIKGTGWVQSLWIYDVIDQTEYDILRTFCPNASAEVYVRTLDKTLAWHTWRAKMVWPVEEPDIHNGSRIKVVFLFRLIELIS